MHLFDQCRDATDIERRLATLLSFVPDGNRTVVTWGMTGDKNFLARAIHLVLDMDKTVGGKFDEGLAQMKVVAEGTARK